MPPSNADETPALIGFDWGTSNARVYLMDRSGGILERFESASGILAVDDFETTATVMLGGLARGREIDGLPIILCGMITSRQGWVETPYVRCPLGLDELAARISKRSFALGDCHFLPGADHRSLGYNDVMRGEETQILGLIDPQSARQLVLLPGTHSKWVLTEAGRILGFSTYMTGELFQTLKNNTILGRLIEDKDFEREAFFKGVEASTSISEGESLMRLLFSVRALPLAGELKAHETGDYLSGLLIGHEIHAALSSLLGDRPQGIIICANDLLTERYALALGALGVDGKRAPADVAAIGLFRIARHAGLIRRN